MNELKKYLNTTNIEDLHESQIANFLKDLKDNELQEAIKLIPKELIGDVALELPDRYFDNIIESFEVKDLVEAVKELESDDQTDFMQDLEVHDKQIAQEVFNKLDKQDQDDITLLKTYDENTAGAYMQTELFCAYENQILQDIIDTYKVLKLNDELENIHTLFILDENKRLQYSIRLDSLLIFDFTKSIKENINTNDEKYTPIYVHDYDDINYALKTIQEYDLNALAIVNNNNELLGRITSDDVYDIINEQATDQIYNMAGLDDEAEEDEDIYQAGKTRAVWLGINLITAIIASLVIAMFEDTLNTIIALAILMPIVASMGGNAGTQSLTVVVRQLALEEIAKNDAIRTIKKELILSLVNGSVFALVIGFISILWFDNMLLGLVIALSMIINLLSAGFFGSTIPLILKKFNIDPAIASTVILTTITDIIGFLSFLGLASLILT
jgi:magnesium transporter